MKKLSFLFISMLIIISAKGQEQVATTTWPYLYSEFTNGVIYFNDGKQAKRLLNFDIVNEQIHFIENELIKQLFLNDISSIDIGTDTYVFWEQKAIRVFKAEEKGFVGAFIKARLDQIHETGGAYGSSSTTQATRKLSSIEVSSRLNLNHVELQRDKSMGEPVNWEYDYHLFVNGNAYKASKRSLRKSLTRDQRTAFDKFLKGNKIKWDDPDGLINLLKFFNNKEI